MTKSQIFKAAHEVARRNVRLFGQSYRAAFAEGIVAVYDSIKAGPVVYGFQIIEPKTLWA